MQEYKVENHVSSFLPEGRKWKLVWADEFDGTELDTSKWGFRLNYWGKPGEAYTDEGVVLDGNSHIELHRVEKNGYYVSPQLQTGVNSFDVPKSGVENHWGKTEMWPLGELEPAKFEHRFGYYEVRCKFQKEPDVMWSAFWMQSPSIGTRFDPTWCGIENDIMEHFFDGEASTGNIFGGYGKQYQKDARVNYKLKETEDGFHTFAMHWTPEEYVFYCDGEEVSRTDKYVWQVPQFILLTTEISGYRAGRPLKVGEYTKDYRSINIGEICKRHDGFVDDAFIVDYVRVFDEAE